MLTCRNCGKKYEPTHPKQEDCSEMCLVNRFDLRSRKTRKLARIFAGTMGYRSMSEVRFATRLKDINIKFDYEKDKLNYQFEPQKYVVDFTVDGDLLIEYKGKLDPASRRKMRAVKKCNPNVDLVMIFEKPNNKIYRGSQTTYGDWATNEGFVWFDVKDIDGLENYIKLHHNKRITSARKNSKKTKAPIKAKSKGMARTSSRRKV